MTNKNHLSGTDRCLEASDISMWADQDIIVNVQADEPLIDPALIDLVAKNVTESASVVSTPNTFDGSPCEPCGTSVNATDTGFSFNV